MSEPDDDLFKVPTAEDRYPREAKRAAGMYLSSRRNLVWQLPASVALVAASNLLHSSVPSMIAWGLAVLGLTQFGVSTGRMLTAMLWMSSLRRLVNYSPVPRGMSTAKYAKSVLAETRAVGKLETALTTIWTGEGDLERARQILAEMGLPDVSSSDYEAKDGSPFPVWQRHGVRWQEAPLPDVEHTCTGWTVGLIHAGTEKADTAVYCACGGAQYPELGNSWGMRNQRRREHAQP
jgi:hypothetical protein